MFKLGRGCFSSRRFYSRSSLALPSLATTKDGRGFTVSELYPYNSLQISSIWPEFGHAISSRWNLVRLKSTPVTSPLAISFSPWISFLIIFPLFSFRIRGKRIWRNFITKSEEMVQKISEVKHYFLFSKKKRGA